MANISNPDEQFNLTNRSGDRYMVNIKEKGRTYLFELCDKRQRHEHTAEVKKSAVRSLRDKAQEVVNTHS